MRDTGYQEAAQPDTQDAGDDETASDDPLDSDENKDLQQHLYQLLLKCIGEDRYSRLVEVKDIKQLRLYWRGLQYVWWSERNQNWSLPSQAQALNYGDLNVEDMPRFEYVTNIFQGRGLGYIAVIAGAPPRVKWMPDDADDAVDIETAEGYTKISKLIERWNPIKLQMQDEAYYFWTDGVIGAYVQYEEDEERFGVESIDTLAEGHEEEAAEIRCACGFTSPADRFIPPAVCPQCGTELTDKNVAPGAFTSVPIEGEPEEVPMGREIIRIVGGLNLKRPQWAKEQSHFHYLVFEEEEHYAKLRKQYKQVADEIKPGANLGADDAFERNARLSVAEGTRLLTQTGSAQAVLVTHARAWFRTEAFYMLEDSVRDRLLEIFPNGCKVIFCGPTYCGSKAESMDEHWVIQHAMPGDGQHRPAVGSSMVSVQDRFNNFSNIEAETYEFGLPITYRSADTYDEEANVDQKSEPGAEVPVQLEPNQDIRSTIMMTRADSVSPDMFEHAKDLMGPQSEFLTGLVPALLGAGEGVAQETASGYAMQRDFGMGRMGIFYTRLRQFHADSQTLACKDLCRNVKAKGLKTVKMPTVGKNGDFESEVIDVTALEGDARAYPEGDENFPETWSQQRAVFTQAMGTPYGMELVQEPDNADLAVKFLAIPGLVVPGADARRKALKAISMLTDIPEGAEMSPQMDPMTLVDPEVDEHEAEAATCKRWLISDDGMRAKRENPTGYQNVKMYMLAQKQLIPPPMPDMKPIGENLTANFKDMPPTAQAQILQKLGINVTPQDFIMKLGLDKMAKAPPPRPNGKPPITGIPAAPDLTRGA